ncbi:MAG: hypothetical protein LBV69_08850 [Bacteroidales bacterium]|nr:hypothetical protein [Bacteroidales bacterium]
MLFCLIIYFFKPFENTNIKKYIWLLLFSIKIIAGLSCFFIYYYYYDYSDSDIFHYYDSAKAIYQEKDENFIDYLKIITGINCSDELVANYSQDVNYWTRGHDYGLFVDNKTIIRFNAIVMLLTKENIFGNIIIMAFFSFIGCFASYKAILNLVPQINKYLLIFAIFLIPSCCFWSSALLKEGLIAFSLGFVLYFFSKLYQKQNFWYLLGFIISCFLLFLSKIYVLPIILPCLLFYYFTKKTTLKVQIIALFTTIIIGFSTIILIDIYLLDSRLIETISGKHNDFINLINILPEKGSSFILSRMEANYYSLLSIIPEGLLNVFFRPFYSDIHNSFLLITFIETYSLFIFIILSIIFFKKPDSDTRKFIVFCIIFVFLFYSLIGIYTPNIGSLSRYRTVAQPFFILIFICMTDFEKILKKFQILRIFKP